MLLSVDGSVFVAGMNESGQLGLVDLLRRSCFVKVDLSMRVLAMQCGAEHALVYTENGQIWGAGSNASFELGLEKCQEGRLRVYTRLGTQLKSPILHL
jgi:alpha-tubulin suppressor-like RCC1 family protein